MADMEGTKTVMKYVFLDFETYYSKEYSLKMMTPIEYILDPRFELIGCAVSGAGGTIRWIDGKNFGAFLKTLDPDDTVLISHNALFDMCITSYLYGFTPKVMIDTMGMARALLQHKTGSVSLATIALELGLDAKGDTIQQVEGMNAAAIKAAGLWHPYVNYALNDVELCRKIYHKLRPSFPTQEVLVNDMIIRCVTNPKFVLDKEVLSRHAFSIAQAKAQALARSGVRDPAELRSDERFASALRGLGIDPPMKTSKRTGKQAYAFAKTDHAMIALEGHESPIVQALIAARFGYKTTIEESRTARFQKISNLTIPGKVEGMMPMPLRYGGAHTHRLGGDWKLNVQNLPRPTPTKPSALRNCLTAPSGYTVLAVDASQIEARITAWLCSETMLVEQFRRGEDTYSLFASDLYSKPITKKDNPAERFVGKQAILGLGFGMGAPRFEAQAKSDSHKNGIKLRDFDINEANRIVTFFRTKYPGFRKTWGYLLHEILPRMVNDDCDIEWGPVHFLREKIRLPSGLHLHYRKLRYDDDNNLEQTNQTTPQLGTRMGGSWRYDYGRETKFLHGGKVLENIVQALARIHTMNNAGLAIRKRLHPYGVELALQVHDELVYVVPEDMVKVVKQILLEEMRRPPEWAPDLPLDAEVHEGNNYGDCK